MVRADNDPKDVISVHNTFYHIPEPYNEPVLDYAAGSVERKRMKAELKRQYAQKIEIPLIVGGKRVKTGNIGRVVCPHDHGHVLAEYHLAGPDEAAMAIESALEAKRLWNGFEWTQRAAVFLKMADLLTTKYRFVMNAATMLGQSKTVHQAEIEAVCEMADFLRFNVKHAERIYIDQPLSERGIWNRLEYRPLEGFVFAVSPFNFTAIAGNLATAPALMGNAVVWKPSSLSVLSNYYLMQILEDAGLPGGVINFIPGSGVDIGKTVLADNRLAGLHFTGATTTFQHMWRTIAGNIGQYRNYPRIVGETGGKGFLVMHASAGIAETAAAIVRAGFEYQGQKCSACSRVYVPRSAWPALKDALMTMIKEIRMGDVIDFSNFVNAVIDERAYDNIMGYISTVRSSGEARIVAGGIGEKSEGYYIRPTIVETSDPEFVTMREEIFGPVVTVYVYDDDAYADTLELCDRTSPYGLTGSVFAKDREAVALAEKVLTHSAGNFYINDKPSGAVVGQQPFGGSRASGTNDKAGSYLNLIRWMTTRSIKENFSPPSDFRYTFMNKA